MSSLGRVSLREWREADIPCLTALRNDQKLQALLLARVRGSDAVQVRQWLRERTAGPDSLFFVVVEIPLDQCIGYIQIVGIDWVDSRGDLGICIGPAQQGQGLGTQALRVAIDALRATWGLRKLSLRVRSDNLKAIRCYERLGFGHCGVQRRHIRLGGSWHDVSTMELVLDDRA